MKIWWFVCLIVLSSFAFGLDYQNVYVNDYSNILSPLEENGLASLFNFVEQNSSAEVVFVSVPECGSFGGPSEYAIEIFNDWEIGKRDKDNGMLILYCAEEEKIWVTVGYGLEGFLPDSKIGRYLDNFYIPEKESGNIANGILSFSEAVSNELIENSDEILSGQTEGNNFVDLIIMVVFILVIILFVSYLQRISRTRDSGFLFWLSYIILSMIRVGGSSVGRSGFGGGRSGGGGAGR